MSDKKQHKRIVILGAGVAGITLSLELKKSGEFDVLLMDERRTVGFSPCLLPYYISGEISKKELFKFPKEELESRGIKLILGCEVRKVSVKDKEILFEGDGELRTEPFDVLCLCIGSASPVLRLKSDGSIPVLKLQNPEDADEIRKHAGEGRRAVIVGAGPTGVELAEALKKIGTRAVLVEAENAILPSLVDDDVGRFIERAVSKSAGIITGVKVKEIKAGNVVLEDGRKMEADFIVNCAGFRPDLGLIEGTGIKYNRGVIVDDRFRTSIPHVYACGDCAEVKHIITGRRVLSRFATNAVKQAMLLADILNGNENISYSGFLENWVSVVDGVYFGGCGLSRAECEAHGVNVVGAISQGKNGEVVKMLCSRVDGRIVGLQVVGENPRVVELVNLAAAMIKNRATVYDVKEYVFNYHPIICDVFHVLEKVAKGCCRKLGLM